MFWSVAMTKAARENTADENLQRQGYQTYLPKYISKIGKETKVRILFPRYIFILIEAQWHSINSTLGVSRLILNENKPAQVPDGVIQELKRREVRGLITLPQLGKFREGENLTLADGPFAGYSVLYEGQSDTDRARVLIELLGRKVLIEVSEGSLTAAAMD